MTDRCVVRVPALTPVPARAVAPPRTPAPVIVREGSQGPQGKQGTPGVSTGFGQITYTERTLEASDSFTPNVRGQILFTPTSTADDLNPPFVGHVFWVDNRVVARAMDDLYDLQINLIVTAQVAGGQLRLDADVGSSLGPIASDTQVLFNGAQEPERVTFRLRVQALGNFLANGCALYLTSSVPITTISETVLVAPASIRSGDAIQYGLYELWLAQGNVGTPTDFLNSLKAPPDQAYTDAEIDALREEIAAKGYASFRLLAAQAIGGHKVVRPALTGVVPASSSDTSQAGSILGITHGAASSGAPIEVVFGGQIEEPSWAWALGPVFVGENGGLTQIAPSTGFVQRVGVAVAPTKLAVQIGPATIKL